MLLIPMFDLDIYLVKGDSYSLSVTLPMMAARIEGGGEANITLPAMTLAATAHLNPPGEVVASMPRMTMSASMLSEQRISANLNLPFFTISASGGNRAAAALDRSLPMMTLSARMLRGDVASLHLNMPMFSLEAHSYWTSPANVNLSLPMMSLYSKITTDMVGLCINTKNFALTRYSDFNFNSMAYYNGKLLGVTSSGLYELAGATDNGTAIDWMFRVGDFDIMRNKLRFAIITGDSSTDMKLIVETPEGERYEYDAEPVSENSNEIRVKIGKGIRTRYAIIEISSEDSFFTHDSVKLFGIKGHKVR